MALPALPEESFQRVLCVAAHPDDMEYGTSAAVARWTARGIEVGYLLLTRGEAGKPNPPEETARLRAAEQQAACAIVGVKHLTVLGHPDGVLVYGLDLRRDICREIRRFKPDVVLGTGYDIETPYGFDQADHRAAGLPDGRVLLASGGADGTVRWWDPATGTPVGSPLAGHTSSVNAVAAVPLPDGQVLLASAPCSDGPGGRANGTSS